MIVNQAFHPNFVDADVAYDYAFSKNPAFNLSSQIANIYFDAMRQNVEQMTISTVKIMQEQAIVAWTRAVQSCAQALAENAAMVQEQALERWMRANQKVFELLTTGFVAR
jgi:hypothetical protein